MHRLSPSRFRQRFLFGGHARQSEGRRTKPPDSDLRCVAHTITTSVQPALELPSDTVARIIRSATESIVATPVSI
jgi:hypothetical protein